MKDQIKQVQEYFKNKIIEGDFEIVNIGSHDMTIIVDEEYVFSMWIANGTSGYNQTSPLFDCDPNFIKFGKLSESEQEEAFIHVKPAIIAHRKNKEIVEKQKQIEELKAEINDLEK